jgi:hypothetical protein
MTKRNSLLVTLPAVTLVSSMLAGPAHAHPGWHRNDGGAVVGAIVAGAVIGAAVGAMIEPPPPVAVQIYAPPPPVYVPPPVYYATPPPPVMMVAAPAPRPVLGVSLSGVIDSLGGDAVSAGTAGALQLRSSPNTLISLELQSLEADRPQDGMRRDDLAGLLGLRLYLWDAWLTPYLDGAVGFGRASFQCCATRESATQFLGRYGLGLELRLGRHLAFDGEIAQVHRLRLDAGSGPVLPLEDHERSAEVRGGIAFRF